MKSEKSLLTVQHAGSDCGGLMRRQCWPEAKRKGCVCQENSPEATGSTQWYTLTPH